MKSMRVYTCYEDAIALRRQSTSMYTAVDRSASNRSTRFFLMRLLKQDVVYGRFSPADIGAIQWFIRRLVTRANGMQLFFTLIDPEQQKFPVTPMPSRPATPAWGTPVPSRPSTPLGSVPGTPRGGRSEDPTKAPLRNRHPASHAGNRHSFSKHLHFRLQEHEQAKQDNHLHFSLLHLAHSLSVSSLENAVGVFESQKYLALEAGRLGVKDSPEYTQEFTTLLTDSCDELLVACVDGLQGTREWVAGIRRYSFAKREKVEKLRTERLEHLTPLRDRLQEVLERFRMERRSVEFLFEVMFISCSYAYRHRVLDPYRSAFDPKHVSHDEALEPPPHKYLFRCYLYQYHTMQFAILVIDLVS